MRNSYPHAKLMTLAVATVLAGPVFAGPVAAVSVSAAPVLATVQNQPAAAAGAKAAQTDPVALVVEGRKLVQGGKLDEGISKYQQALKSDPQLYEAHLSLGQALDLKGDYAQARKELDLALASPDADKDLVLGHIATSYVFTGDLANAARFYQQQFDGRMAANRLDGAAETANALGRAYLEHADVKNARRWYETANQTIKKVSGLPQDQLDLFEMRWHHALSRIAARSKNKAAAAKEAAAVKALIDKGGTNAKQQPIYDYLIGYNAFYAGDYDAALASLQKAAQDDPFIVGLIAQSYAKKKDAAAAKAAWTKVLGMHGHSLQNAIMRPQAKKAMASS